MGVLTAEVSFRMPGCFILTKVALSAMNLAESAGLMDSAMLYS
jgi:hypothetical protein